MGIRQVATGYCAYVHDVAIGKYGQCKFTQLPLISFSDAMLEVLAQHSACLDFQEPARYTATSGILWQILCEEWTESSVFQGLFFLKTLGSKKHKPKTSHPVHLALKIHAIQKY
jgi:hypothetical protein